MGLFDRSSKSSNTTIATDYTFNNVDNRVGSDGGAIGGNVNTNQVDSGNNTTSLSKSVGNVIVNSTTDHGAVQSALNTSRANTRDTLLANVNALDSAVHLGETSLVAGTTIARNAFEYGAGALSQSVDLANNSLYNAGNIIDTGLSYAGGILSKGLDYAVALASNAQASENDLVTQAIGLAGETQRSEAATALQNISKYAIVGLGLVVAGVVVYTVFKKG